MRKTIVFIFVTFIALQGFSQQNVKITEKITYNVKIKSEPNPSGDHFFENINESQRVFYVKKLFEAARSGKLKAFADDKFIQSLSIKDVNNILTIKDTASVPSPDDPSRMITVTSEDEIYPEEITALAFVEQWNFNLATLKINKKIIAVAPLLEYIVESSKSQEVSGYKFLFWLKMP